MNESCVRLPCVSAVRSAARARAPDRQSIGLARVLLPFWLAPVAFDLLLAVPLGARAGVFTAHAAVLVLAFHAWHRALHDPRSGPLFRQHSRHHVQNYPRHRPATPRYLADGGVAQEVSLSLCALAILLGSALLGTPPGTLFGCALGFAGLLVGGGYLHRAMHTQPTPLARYRWFRDLRALHLRHHIDARSNFGIVEYGVDALLGSLRGPVRSPAAATEPASIVERPLLHCERALEEADDQRAL